ncbi:MAG: hypothetical protein DI547_05040 [Sphingobium sp.]|nr:MAG: hypothetical protein DI547_05040 [Sphingobium sp.]
MTREQELDAAVRRVLSPLPSAAVSQQLQDKLTDKHVLLAIAMGLVAILLAIILGLFLTPRALPNWAENVFVSIATASALKLGDCVNAIVALSSGRSVERLGTQLANTSPLPDGGLKAEITNDLSNPIPTETVKP